MIFPLAAGLLLGTVMLQSQAVLPTHGLALCLAVAGGVGLLIPCAPRCGRRTAFVLVFVAASAVGFGATSLRAESRLSDRLAAGLEGIDVAVTGRIAEMPRKVDHGSGFVFETLDAPRGIPSHLQISWYRSASAGIPDLRAGQVWRLTVRLKRPHGTLNPHGSDREAMLLAEGVGATGYVREVATAHMIADEVSAPMIAVERLRQSIRDRFERALPQSPWRGVLVALAIGDQDAVSAEQWRLFARSGITHLISISGVHVTVWALVAGAALAGFWRRVPWLALRLPAQAAGALFGLLAATGYVALAGAAVPAQRSLVMLGMVALATHGGRTVRPALALASALVAVLLWDPWCVLSKGTWLSFVAVALLLWGAGQTQGSSAVRSWLAAQWAIGLGLAPALLALTGQVSLVAPLANLVAVPLVTFVLLPLELLFVVCDWAPSLDVAAWLFDWLARGLDWLAAPAWAIWQQAAAPGVLVLAASAAALWLLAPRGVPGRGAAAAVFIALLCWQPPRPPQGSFDLVMLDVGQGLATHVRTASHDLLFDTGPRYGISSDAGQRIVVPYLRGEGVARLDGLVVSHDDSDHSGGALAIIDAIAVAQTMASLPEPHPLRGTLPALRPCVRGEHWEWDGVHFDVLHPSPDHALGGNRNSCVLRVSAGAHAVLLAADIELASEDELAAAGALAPTDVVVAPHHGSRSSSGAPFIAALAPAWVMYSVGYRSRFGHPHDEVAARYREAGATDLRTDRDGAIRLHVDAEGIAVERWRETAQRYWHTGFAATR
nr:DNA internalization-related competence protein ComEC/Rec2 [Niveibacterium umoris]